MEILLNLKLNSTIWNLVYQTVIAVLVVYATTRWLNIYSEMKRKEDHDDFKSD